MKSKINRSIITPLSCLLLLITTLATSLSYAAANITVTTSRNPVALDDSFHLIYEADSDVDDDPDFSPIYEHFDILNSGQSTNMRFINGNYSLKKSWDLAIIAKDIGKFTIPPIAFGKDISPAIQITVSNGTSPNSTSPNGQASIPAKIFLESELDKKEGWVQSQFIYTIRLLRTVSIAGASLTEPVTNDPDAIIEALGEDTYQTTRNGIRYEVFERRYAIFPQKSGPLKIDPATFEGRINATQAQTIFDQFRMSGQLKRLRSSAVEAMVKAAPDSINLQDWIPASDLQLVEEWSDDIQTIKTGEPVTRTITIIAEGLTAVQLPDLKFAEISDLKQYPDKPVTENRKNDAGLNGIKQFKIALIPAIAGTFTLPEIKLQWWNTKTNKLETARLAATTLTAIGDIQTATKPNAMTNPTTSQDAANETPAQENQLPTDSTTSLAPLPANDQPYWKWLTVLFAVAWLLTSYAFFKKKTPPKQNTVVPVSASIVSIKSAAKKVEEYASENDAYKTKTALINWAKKYYSDRSITNLTQITARCSAALTDEIRQLNESLYSTTQSSWQGKDFLSAFKNEHSAHDNRQNEHETALKPLYHS